MRRQIRNVVEAALFAAEAPLSIGRLTALFSASEKVERKDVESVLIELVDQYSGSGIELIHVANGYRFQTRQEYAPWLRRLHGTRSPRYSKALLETLAIIAYRQPVTRGDIEEVRGVGVTTEIMRTLLEREWVQQKGVREVPGRPALYGTTVRFLEYFGLVSLTELPKLGDQRQLTEIARDLGIILPSSESESVNLQNQENVTADNEDATVKEGAELTEDAVSVPLDSTVDSVGHEFSAEHESDDELLETKASVIT